MELVEEYQPDRIAIDSLSSLERIGTGSSYRRFLTGLTAFVKNSGVATLLTLNSSQLIGGASQSEGEIATMSDGLILLRYAEVDGRVQRALTLLKLRGTGHDHDVRQYTISDEGLIVGEPLATLPRS
jgi:circadian clock protein KaiC